MNFPFKKGKKRSSQGTSYAYNRSIDPFPDAAQAKAKPPTNGSLEDTKDLFPKQEEKTKEKVIQEFMDTYRKAERAVVVNFYTGGNAYKKGIMDSIYRGLNPMNP